MVLTESDGSIRDKNESQNKMDKKDKPATKVVIRRLPPSMTQEEFLNQVSPIPNYNYIYTIKGDNSLGGNAFARVYVNFTNTDDIYIFKEKFDNYIFIDGNGHEYAAVVEYASFQKVPKRRKQRVDLKTDTIESDPAYISFLESMNEQPNQEEKPEFNLNLANTENKNEITTPLLDFLKQRKVDRLRMRDEKREERRKKEHEKKKLRDEDRKKRLDEKKQKNLAHKEAKKDQKERENEKENKNNTDELNFKDTPDEEENKPAASGLTDGKKEKTDQKMQKPEKTFKPRNKFEDKEKKMKQKFKYEERKEQQKMRREDFRERERERDPPHRPVVGQVEKKNEAKPDRQKKVKKYSERREERKIVEASKEEAKKAESAKKENAGQENQLEVEKKDDTPKEKTKKTEKDTSKDTHTRNRDKDDDGEYSGKKNRENDTRSQRRIRNKDRPAMQIYKPGMLRKKSVDNDKDSIVIDEDKHEVKEIEKPATEEL